MVISHDAATDEKSSIKEIEFEVIDNVIKYNESSPLKYQRYTLDKAIRAAGNGKFQLIVLLVTGVASMTILIESLGMGIVLPSAKCDLNISTSEQGFLNSVGFMGVVISSHFWGFMIDAWGRQKTLRLTLAMSFVCSVVSSFSMNTLMLLISRFVVGICVSGVKTSSIAYLGEVHTNKNRSKFLTFIISFTTMGIVAQPVIALAILTRSFEYEIFPFLIFRPWRAYILAGNILTASALFGIYFLPETPNYVMAMGRPDECLAILSQIYAFNSGKPRENYPVKVIEMDEGSGYQRKRVKSIADAFRLVWNQTWPLFVPPHFYNIVLMAVLSFMIFGVCQGYELWYPQILVYYTKHMDLSVTTCEVIAMEHTPNILTNESFVSAVGNITLSASTVTSATENVIKKCGDVAINPETYYPILAMGITFVTINTAVGFAIRRMGKTILLTTWSLVAAICALGLVWSHQFYLSTILSILKVSSMAMVNVLITVSGDLFPTVYKGMAISLIFMFGRIGTFVNINITSILLFGYCDFLFLLNGILLLVSVFGCFYIARKTDALTIK